MVEVNLQAGGDGFPSVTFFAKSIETLEELHGKRTVDQKQLDQMIKELENVEKLYIKLPKE